MTPQPELARIFTLPIRYSNQDFDEIAARAAELTEADRLAGRPVPRFGYSAENIARARAEYREAVKAYEGR